MSWLLDDLTSLDLFHLQLKYDLLRKSDPNAKKLSVPQKQLKYVEAAAEVMGPIVEAVKPLYPIKIWEDISPQFLVSFWSLTLYDLYVPVDAYAKEIAKLKQSAAQVLESKDMVSSFSDPLKNLCCTTKIYLLHSVFAFINLGTFLLAIQ